MKYEGLDPGALAERLRVPSCLALAKVTSTLDIIHQLAAEGAPSGTVVLADEQVRGRGRQGRYWHSPKGSGIWLGSLKRPDHPVEGGLLAIRVGIAVVRAIEGLGVNTQIKWPNDIMVDDRKLGGILCEARWLEQRVSWVAVGIGLNVYGPLPAEIRERAVALDEVLPGIDRITVLEALVPWLDNISVAPSLTPQERRDYTGYDWLEGRRLVAPVAGEAIGVDEDGALLVRTCSGSERIIGGGIVPA